MNTVNRLDMFSTGNGVKENEVTHLDKKTGSDEYIQESLFDYVIAEDIDTFAEEEDKNITSIIELIERNESDDQKREIENNLKLIAENKILKEKIQMLEIEIENLTDKLDKFRSLEKCNKGGRPFIAFDIEEYKSYKSIGYSNTEIAYFMNVSLSTLKNRIKKVSI